MCEKEKLIEFETVTIEFNPATFAAGGVFFENSIFAQTYFRFLDAGNVYLHDVQGWFGVAALNAAPAVPNFKMAFRFSTTYGGNSPLQTPIPIFISGNTAYQGINGDTFAVTNEAPRAEIGRVCQGIRIYFASVQGQTSNIGDQITWGGGLTCRFIKV